jgi:hypothetical protein
MEYNKNEFERLFDFYLKQDTNPTDSEKKDPLENEDGQLTEQELLKSLFIRQAMDIKAVKGYLKFFVILTIIGIVGSIILWLALQ